jgi:hydroxymethylpyrimidine/phosphomethylpyrimidine kinase
MVKNSTPDTLHSTLEKPVLLISASDSSASAGMQVDLRVLQDLGNTARCAITAVTVQGNAGAISINPVDPNVILESINTALADAPGIGAVKIGLLGDEITADILEEPLTMINALDIPVVLDPVMRSTPGSALSTTATARAVVEKILPYTTLLTPNRDELHEFSILTGSADQEEAGKVRRIMESGVKAVLITGGDTDEDQCLDVLYGSDGKTTEFRHPRIGNKAPRGTGCALSTTIAVHLSRGRSMVEAVGWSVDYVTGLIEQAVAVGEQLLLLPGGSRH